LLPLTASLVLSKKGSAFFSIFLTLQKVYTPVIVMFYYVWKCLLLLLLLCLMGCFVFLGLTLSWLRYGLPSLLFSAISRLINTSLKRKSHKHHSAENNSGKKIIPNHVMASLIILYTKIKSNVKYILLSFSNFKRDLVILVISLWEVVDC